MLYSAITTVIITIIGVNSILNSCGGGLGE